MPYQWNNEYFGQLENYSYNILLLGPGDDSQDYLMLKKRKDVQYELQKFPNIHTQFYTIENVMNKDNWLPEVKTYATDKADYVFCLLSSSVPLFAEGAFILPLCRDKLATFYNSTEMKTNSDLKVIIERLRESRIKVLAFPADRIDECHICSMIIGIVYSRLQNESW